MAETFPWVKARQALRDAVGREAFPEPEPVRWTSVKCPACSYVFEVPAYLYAEYRDGLYVIPGHTEGGGYAGEVCWVGGWSLKAAQEMVEMRTADNGRLLRAAHP